MSRMSRRPRLATRSKFGRTPERGATGRPFMGLLYNSLTSIRETLLAALSSHHLIRSPIQPTSRSIERFQRARPTGNNGRINRTLDIWPGSFHLLFSTRLSQAVVQFDHSKPSLRDKVVDRRLLISHPENENTPINPSRKSQQTL
jgi:hypothetical protein